MSTDTLITEIERKAKVIATPDQDRGQRLWPTTPSQVASLTRPAGLLPTAVTVSLLYAVLFLGGVWASVNLLRWFWREIL